MTAKAVLADEAVYPDRLARARQFLLLGGNHADSDLIAKRIETWRLIEDMARLIARLENEVEDLLS